MTSKFKAAVFDLDGTLLNTLDDLADGTNAALTHYGYPPRTLDEVRRFVGNGVRNLVIRALPDGENTPNFEEVFSYFCSYYTAHSRIKTAPYPGILEALTELKKSGVKIAVVSNKLDSAVRELCDLFFGGLVDAAIGDLEGRPRKPAPDGTLTALREMGVLPKDAAFIGDSDVDIITGRNAGLTPIGVLWGFRDRECLVGAGADLLVADADELIRLLSE